MYKDSSKSLVKANLAIAHFYAYSLLYGALYALIHLMTGP